ncbi:MAG: hypothetical protein LQ345_003345 [Seirophora villosa]|nr:MAG: hypothetical protein LQ345_003345 [Seirophora villosa]
MSSTETMLALPMYGSPFAPMDVLPATNSKEVENVQHAARLTKAYRERDSNMTLAAILNNYVVALTCIAMSESAASASSLPQSVGRIIYLLAVVIIASRIRALENLVHEASHNNLFQSATSHRRLQFLYAFPVFRIVEDYRRSHLVHHKHLGDPQKDPDIVRLFDLGLDKLPERPTWYLLGLPMTGFLTYEYLTTSFWEFWESSTSRSTKLFYWTSVMLGVAYWDLYRIFLAYYLVPFLVVLPVTRYWAEISEHLGLDLHGNFGSSRTNIGILHQWYLNPHNDGYHAVHHLCSQVPFHLLPKAHASLMEASEEFGRKSTISHGVLETFRQMKTAKTLVKDTSTFISEQAKDAVG